MSMGRYSNRSSVRFQNTANYAIPRKKSKKPTSKNRTTFQYQIQRVRPKKQSAPSNLSTRIRGMLSDYKQSMYPCRDNSKAPVRGDSIRRQTMSKAVSRRDSVHARSTKVNSHSPSMETGCSKKGRKMSRQQTDCSNAQKS